jgi:hypothetical protein
MINMEPYEVIEKDGKRLEIHHDDTPMNPRKDFDNLGKMVCFHDRRHAPNEMDINFDEFRSWNEVAEELRRRGARIVLDIWAYEHGGMALSTGERTGQFADRWDSAQFGLIVAMEEELIKSYGENWKEYEFSFTDKAGTKLKGKEGIIRILDGEVETYNQWAEGDVYGYIIKKVLTCKECGHEIEDEDEDSCWGFFGSDWENNGMKEQAGEEFSDLFDAL